MSDEADSLTQQPFEKVEVFLGVMGGAHVSWWPKTDLPQPTPWTFRVEHAATPAGDWSTIVDDLTSNTAVLDPARYKYDILAEGWYRVVLVDADDEEYPGEPVHVGVVLNRRDWLIAKETCRRSYQRMRLSTGRAGWLLKRKSWGALCENCGNPVTGQETNSDCAECYGTGVTGGYHDPFPMMMELGNLDLLASIGPEPSNRHIANREVLAVNFPRLEHLDVWVDHDSGRRFVVQERIRTAVEKRGIPLVVSLHLQPIETTDVVYGLAVPSTAPYTGYQLGLGTAGIVSSGSQYV